MIPAHWDAANTERDLQKQGSKSLFLVVVIIIIFSLLLSSFSLSLSLFRFFFSVAFAPTRFGFQSNGRTRWNNPLMEKKTNPKKKRSKRSESQQANRPRGRSNDGSCSLLPYHTRFIFHLHIFICNGPSVC
jgi:hypothetical protein